MASQPLSNNSCNAIIMLPDMFMLHNRHNQMNMLAADAIRVFGARAATIMMMYAGRRMSAVHNLDSRIQGFY